MSAFTPLTTVQEVQQQHPALLKVLTSSGLYREGDPAGLTLAELCLNFGLHPGIIIRMLETTAARVLPQVAPIDTAPFETMTLTELVEHIEQQHHAYLREELPELTALTEKVAGVHHEDERLGKLRDEVVTLAEELLGHLQHEEESLFPMIRDIESTGAIAPTVCGDSVGGPIACMENEHERAELTLKRLRDLTDNYSPPDHACNSYRRMLFKLTRFDRDLVEHMYKENELLFPRALEAQQKMRQTASS